MDDKKQEAWARAFLSIVADDPVMVKEILRRVVAEREVLENETNTPFNEKKSILLDRLNDLLEND